MKYINHQLVQAWALLASLATETADRYHNSRKTQYYISLARLNKPIGIYLLLWPTLWGLWFANKGFPTWHLFLVFCLGTVLTRSAGCVINDIADRKFDGKVQRTDARPLIQGQLSLAEALGFMAVLLALALLLVLTTNKLTLGLAVLASLVAGIYPFMKRYTYLPQVVLGVAFSFGIPMAFAATQNTVPNTAWLLMIANILWTVAYDTEYAMVDREDDLKLGLKSTAILFADMDKFMIGLLQSSFIVVLLLLARSEQLGWPYLLGLVAASSLLMQQQLLMKDRQRDACFKAFLNNHWVGLSIFIGVLLQFQL